MSDLAKCDHMIGLRIANCECIRSTTAVVVTTSNQGDVDKDDPLLEAFVYCPRCGAMLHASEKLY